MHALDYLVRSGKVRYVGASNYTSWRLMKALGIAGRLDLAPLVSHQIYYSLQAREAEYELIPLAVDQGLGVLVWSPLAGGLRSGKYRRNHQAPVGSRQLSDWGEPPVYDPEGLYDLVELLISIAEQHEVSAAQVALARTLGRPGVTSMLGNARATSARHPALPESEQRERRQRPGQRQRGHGQHGTGPGRDRGRALGDQGEGQRAQRGTEELHRGDRDRVAALPQIIAADTVAGETDYLLTVAARDVAELQQVLTSLALHGGSRLVTYLRLAEIKPPSRLPLGPP